MTATTDFDRLLGAVLEADGPQGLPPGMVDAALAESRTLGQRRPLIPLLDGLGWPPIGWPLPRAASRRFVLLAFVALLGAAVVASALLIAGGRPRPLVGAGERIYLWANGRAYLVTGDGVSSHAVPAFRGEATDCATLVPGTSIVTRGGFGQWHLIDLMTGQEVGSVSTDYGGGERWSPGGATLAQFDFTGRVGITTFVDPTRPLTRWVPVPGVIDVAWSLAGDRLAALAVRDGVVVIDVIDAASGAATTTVTTLTGATPSIGWASNGPVVEVREGTRASGGFTSTTTLVDTHDGSATTLTGIHMLDGQVPAPGPGALTPDGAVFALPSSSTITLFDRQGAPVATIVTDRAARDLAWSSDGRLLAFRDGERLVVADIDGRIRASADLDPSAPFLWDRVGSDLVVARPAAGGALVERYRGDDLTLVAGIRATSLTPVGSGRPAGSAVTGGASLQVCLQLDSEPAAP